MYTEEEIDIINAAMTITGREKTTAEGISKVAKAYKIVFGTELCSGCKNEAQLGLNKLMAYFSRSAVTQNKIHNKIFIMNRQYQLKSGFLITNPKTGQIYSNANLTDEVAEEILAQIPSAIKRFSQVPEEPTVFAKHEPNTDDLRGSQEKYILSLSDREELREIARERGYAENKWKRLNVTGLQKYLIKRLNNEVNNS